MKPVFRDGQVHVMVEMCSSCIFRPGNLMTLQPGRVKSMVDDCLSMDGGNIPCHQTLGADQGICRGYWDAYSEKSSLLQIAKRMDMVAEQPLPPVH